MAVDVARPSPGHKASGVVAFVTTLRHRYQEMVAEMRRVTWPDRQQTIDATWRIIVFVLFLGLVIWVMDLVLQGILVRGIPSLFGGGRG